MVFLFRSPVCSANVPEPDFDISQNSLRSTLVPVVHCRIGRVNRQACGKELALLFSEELGCLRPVGRDEQGPNSDEKRGDS